MGYKTGLGAAGAITVTEHNDGQVIIPDKARDPIVDHGHCEQRRCAFFRLHATRRDKADHGQSLYGALHQQFAEPNAI